MKIVDKIKRTVILGLGITLLFSSCNDIENLNTDTKGYETVLPEALMTQSQVSYMYFLTNTNPNSNNFRKYVQYWTNTEFVDEDRYNQTKRNIGTGFWNLLYRDVLTDFKNAKEIIISQNVTPNKEAEKQNKIAIVEIQMIAVFQTLVDLYGDVPYTEALDFVKYPKPKYDDAQEIYLSLADRLNKAINQLNTNESSFSSGDLIYGGNVNLWKKLANSIKLKLGLHLADIPELNSDAKDLIESAFKSGVISNNSENALLQYYSVSGQRNPIFLALTTENHYVPTKFLVDELNSKKDPRRDIFFNSNSKINGEYVGYPYAIGPSGGGYQNTSNTNIEIFRDPSLPGVLFDFAETSFLLADAANRGFDVGGTSATYYMQGIEASMDYWNVSSLDKQNYLNRPDVSFNTASGTTKEKIAYQLWISYYNRGFEAWTEYRRLDFPNIKAPDNAVSEADGKVPVRNIYSHLEATLNKTNYETASAKIGGDLMTTKIFWDKY
ncbi:SusD/RagB family nutrient-binding outer membrane lipoprotein [Tenacibaculum mesophilum]|uniref:SusD/RagB family nutrient-binding outer membrane lipoprotein n=2 Tax=Tenacibaculum TaxID=104267 RepID=A0AAE9MP83_9FLAO|nr:SusD/RagB family nutrient-binding outer membrane lipoprotein [Tenacibaculum mesophilum]UTD15293.1 SusD/RagB family nutrient-binding outer membrane lipoprotein [Tenacibaculum mesophilum]GFD76258.1 hypothetical protein KUL113_56780 [Tenacibaculum sp. KUL113]GFD82299.1 hypothetical protein KUL118_51610 [Tenacibaculum sp. KUL118]GFD96528.1 hypothetical protein KUL154_52610 [Alteromonas sp. KUL154]